MSTMTDNLNVHDNLYEYNNTAEEFRKDSGGDTMSFCEDITVMKTEVKEEYYDFEMPLEMTFENVKEEYISSPENVTKENLELVKSTEQPLNENIVIGSYEFGEEVFQENKYKYDLGNISANLKNHVFNGSSCKYTTHKKSLLTQHSSTRSADKPFKCTYEDCKCTSKQKEFCECNACDYAGGNKRLLKLHILTRHSAEPKKYKCEECKYETHIKASMVLHSRIHVADRPFKCTYINCKCTPEQDECKCDSCGYGAVSSSILKHHILLKHSTELKKYICSYCNYGTHTKAVLTRHIRTHTNERPFKCSYKNCKCTPGQKEPCKCDRCVYAATNKSSLNRHILVMHSREPKKYKCTDCEYATHKRTHLVAHMHLHTGDQPFKCTYKNCECTAGQDEPCKCDTCGYAGSHKNDLLRHILVRHSGEPKKFRCKDCNYATHMKTDLVKHMRSHTGDKPFKCTYKNCECPLRQDESCSCNTCGYAATQKASLRTHVLAMHTEKSKKYKCRDCKYATHVKRYLRRHLQMQNHTSD